MGYHLKIKKRNDDLIMKELDKMSSINNVNISNKKDFELNLSMEELQKRTHKDYLTTKKMLAVDAPEYLNVMPREPYASAGASAASAGCSSFLATWSRT